MDFHRFCRTNLKTAKKVFDGDWEKLFKEELINAGARLAGFIESTTEKEKTIRDVSKYWVIVVGLDIGKSPKNCSSQRNRRLSVWKYINNGLRPEMAFGQESHKYGLRPEMAFGQETHNMVLNWKWLSARKHLKMVLNWKWLSAGKHKYLSSTRNGFQPGNK